MLRNDLYSPWFANKEDWGFEILTGDFLGVVVQVEKVNVQNSGEVEVDYHVINKPESLTDEELNGDLFKEVFNVVINDILKEAIENFENEQNRNNNSKEPDSQ